MSLAPQAILHEITGIARVVFDDASLELSPDTTSDDIPSWDSLSHITLVVETECHFGIRFETVEVEELKSVGELIRLIQAKLALVAA